MIATRWSNLAKVHYRMTITWWRRYNGPIHLSLSCRCLPTLISCLSHKDTLHRTNTHNSHPIISVHPYVMTNLKLHNRSFTITYIYMDITNTWLYLVHDVNKPWMCWSLSGHLEVLVTQWSVIPGQYHINTHSSIIPHIVIITISSSRVNPD